MNRSIVTISITLGFVCLSVPAQEAQTQKTTVPCSIKFSLAERDALGNINIGFSSDGQKWFEKKLSKKYPNVCYAKQEPNAGIWFLISVSTQTEEVVPRVVNYPVYTLKIERMHEGTTDVLRTFERAKSGTTAGGIPGLVATMKNPERDVISDAVAWLASADLPEIHPVN